MDEKSLIGPVFLFLIFWYHALKTREKVHDRVTTAYSSMNGLADLLSERRDNEEDEEDEDAKSHFLRSIEYIDRVFLRDVSLAFVAVPVWTFITGFSLMTIFLLIARLFDFFNAVKNNSNKALDQQKKSKSINMLSFVELARSLSENEVYYNVNYLFYRPDIALSLAIIPFLITVIYVFFIVSPLDKIDARLLHVHIDVIFACIILTSAALIFSRFF